MDLSKVSWDSAKDLLVNQPVMLLFGSVEEHGYHLPMDADTQIMNAVVSSLEEDFNIHHYPAITFGQVYSAREYEGTISINEEILVMYGKEVVHSMIRANVSKVILYSFHNGNLNCLKMIQRQVKEEGFQEIYILSYPNIDKDVSELLEAPSPNGIWHAGELETSLMLYLNEQGVDLKKAVIESQGANRKQQLRGDHWRCFNPSGAFGDPTIATKEKGEKIYKKIVSKLKKDLEIILEEENKDEKR